MGSIQVSVQNLGWVLLHSLWVGALVWLTVKILYIIIPARLAALRYKVGLLGIVALSVWVGWLALQQWRQTDIEVAPSASVASVQASIYQQPINHAGPTSFVGLDELDWLISRVEPLNIGLVIFWFIGLFFNLIRTGLQYRFSQSLRHRDLFPCSRDLQERANKWAIAMRIRPEVTLRLSSRVPMPCTMGFLKPVILFPIGMLTSIPNSQLELILLHELAHVKRRDYLVNLFQSVLDILFFFNPGYRAISSMIRAEREHACDDMAVSLSGTSVDYAKALVQLVETQTLHSKLAMASARNKEVLMHRIQRLFQIQPQSSIVNFKAISVLGLLISTCFLAAFGWSSTSVEDFAPSTNVRLEPVSAVISQEESQAEDQKALAEAKEQLRRQEMELRAQEKALREKTRELERRQIAMKQKEKEMAIQAKKMKQQFENQAKQQEKQLKHMEEQQRRRDAEKVEAQIRLRDKQIADQKRIEEKQKAQMERQAKEYEEQKQELERQKRHQDEAAAKLEKEKAKIKKQKEVKELAPKPDKQSATSMKGGAELLCKLLEQNGWIEPEENMVLILTRKDMKLHRVTRDKAPWVKTQTPHARNELIKLFQDESGAYIDWSNTLRIERNGNALNVSLSSYHGTGAYHGFADSGMSHSIPPSFPSNGR